jgi:hypothetical protein
MIEAIQIGLGAGAFLFALAALAWCGDHLNLSQPEPRTRRPDPVDPCDFSEALRPIGGPPRWEDTKEQR